MVYTKKKDLMIMTLNKLLAMSSLTSIALALILPASINAATPIELYNPADYNFLRAEETTKNGYPLPLTGQPITKTPVITKKPDSKVKKYPKYYIPQQETLAKDEMRITVCGSWATAPIRIGQGASCLFVQLGNGDNFIFDIGGGSLGNLYSLGVHPATLDKLFITHLHLDHVGGILNLFDAMGWARNTPLNVWGPSGFTPDLGTAAFTKNIRQAANWHVQSKSDVLPTGGTKIVTREIDISKFSPENPRQLAYDENGVKIYAFPVIHTIAGAMGYRLEWNGLTFVYTADSEPSNFEAEQAKGADVFIHEVMPSVEEFSDKNHMPLPNAQNVMNQHTTPAELGLVFDIAKPRLGVGMHFSMDDELIDPLFKRWRSTYNGPVVLAQDLTTINVTSEYIVIRQAKTDPLAWPPKPPTLSKDIDMNPGKPSKAQRPSWLSRTRIHHKP
ncbi:MAG: guanitoxin biosynthesis MBL fold metallo-hydrolase GntH [Gammaproteobacteria bacterium]